MSTRRTGCGHHGTTSVEANGASTDELWMDHMEWIVANTSGCTLVDPLCLESGVLTLYLEAA